MDRRASEELQGAAQTLRVRLQLLEVRAPTDLEEAFSAMSLDHADALIAMPSVVFYEVHRRIVDLATRPAAGNLRIQGGGGSGRAHGVWV
jgi:hypothetical protein